MAELTAADVQSFTNGRVLAADPNTPIMLNAALTVARRDAGWSVSPVVANDSVVLDGPDSRILPLPTRKLVTLHSVTEDGTALNLANLTWSAGGPPGMSERPVSVRKKGQRWWSAEYQAVTVVMTHGYTEAEAADWRYAILSMVDQMSSYSVTGRSDADLLTKRVDDVAYTWANPYLGMAETVCFSMNHIFANYRLPRLEFL